MNPLIFTFLILASVRLDAALATHEEILAQWPFGTTQQLTVAEGNKPKASSIVFGKMQVTIPELVKAGFTEPIAVKCQMRDVQIGKSYAIVGESKANDGRTLKLEIRCDPQRKQVIGNVTISDAEGNAKSLVIDTPSTPDPGKPKPKTKQ
jgi:hypothetical protein